MMTPRQRDLARHALGLNGVRKSASRNHFCTGVDGDYDDWMSMVDGGLAVRSAGPRETLGGCYVFWLTPKGAELAANTGETVNEVAFPGRTQPSAPGYDYTPLGREAR